MLPVVFTSFTYSQVLYSPASSVPISCLTTCGVSAAAHNVPDGGGIFFTYTDRSLPSRAKPCGSTLSHSVVITEAVTGILLFSVGTAGWNLKDDSDFCACVGRKTKPAAKRATMRIILIAFCIADLLFTIVLLYDDKVLCEPVEHSRPIISYDNAVLYPYSKLVFKIYPRLDSHRHVRL